MQAARSHCIVIARRRAKYAPLRTPWFRQPGRREERPAVLPGWDRDRVDLATRRRMPDIHAYQDAEMRLASSELSAQPTRPIITMAPLAPSGLLRSTVGPISTSLSIANEGTHHSAFPLPRLSTESKGGMRATFDIGHARP
jgi:hypothetical protein